MSKIQWAMISSANIYNNKTIITVSLYINEWILPEWRHVDSKDLFGCHCIWVCLEDTTASIAGCQSRVVGRYLHNSFGTLPEKRAVQTHSSYLQTSARECWRSGLFSKTPKNNTNDKILFRWNNLYLVVFSASNQKITLKILYNPQFFTFLI